MEKIKLIALGEEKFLNHHFIIPYFQRGYRWTKKEVTNLLDDILEFAQKPKKEEGEFYCLQPIVVVKEAHTENWLVIDGQQRLTTLFILLSYLADFRLSNDNTSGLFTIEYQTRNTAEQNSKMFLKNINNIIVLDKSNADYYHMSLAYITIKEWFENKKISKSKILEVLLETDKIDNNDFDSKNNLRFIWYEIPKDETVNDEKIIEVFSRLNKGKIPLTNAELIKALYFISNKNEEDKKKDQLQKGYEWDKMEFALQEKSFWYFLSNKDYRGDNHLEFIFEILAKKYEKHAPYLTDYKEDNLYTYLVFNELITKKILPENKSNTLQETREFLWEEIKKTYNLLEDLFQDNTYYHLIGFLNHQEIKNISIIDIINLENKKEDEVNVEIVKNEKIGKKEYKKKIIEKIQELLPEKIEELNYEDNHKEIKALLLLFNVLISKNSNYIRFPFDKYHEGKWSLEHIHAKNSANLIEKQKRFLLEEQQFYFKNVEEDFYNRIYDLLEMKEINDVLFNVLQKDIFQKYTNGQPEHSIKNMALLTVGDNTILNNSIFPVKRDLIKILDEKGSFIPLGTKNVFYKYYSKNVEQNVSWNIEDQTSYLEELKTVLKDYLPTLNG